MTLAVTGGWPGRFPASRNRGHGISWHQLQTLSGTSRYQKHVFGMEQVKYVGSLYGYKTMSGGGVVESEGGSLLVDGGLLCLNVGHLFQGWVGQ